MIITNLSVVIVADLRDVDWMTHGISYYWKSHNISEYLKSQWFSESGSLKGSDSVSIGNIKG